jgi:predicted Fe-Mo cluster-binding NifX family protein
VAARPATAAATAPVTARAAVAAKAVAMDPAQAEAVGAAGAPEAARHDPKTPTNESETTMTDQAAKTIRIAVPSEAPGGLQASRSGHFGRCECFTMVDLIDGEIGEVEVLANAPHTEGGCMAPVLVLAEHNVDAIVVDGIGGRPLMGFNQVGIAVHAGVGADVQSTVHAFIEGGLPEVGFENACQH